MSILNDSPTQLFKRIIPYQSIITALTESYPKIKASPHLFQLCVILLLRRYSSEVITAFQLQRDEKIEHGKFISIDLCGIYEKTVWNNIKEQDRDGQKIEIK